MHLGLIAAGLLAHWLMVLAMLPELVAIRSKARLILRMFTILGGLVAACPFALWNVIFAVHLADVIERVILRVLVARCRRLAPSMFARRHMVLAVFPDLHRGEF